MYYLYAALIGVLSGITSGLFGVGGGIVMVPAMLFLLQMKEIKVAIGTSLAVMIANALVGTWRNQQHDYVDWKLVALIIPMAVVGSWCAAGWMHHLSSAVLKRAFGGFLVLIGCRLLFLK